MDMYTVQSIKNSYRKEVKNNECRTDVYEYDVGRDPDGYS